MQNDALEDLLLDLKHDLGKYLLLPLALLPDGAGEPALRAALRRALLETRKRGDETQSARALWEAFDAELAAHRGVVRRSGYARLRAAVLRALDWERALAQGGPLERKAIERDFREVQAAIAELAGEVRSG